MEKSNHLESGFIKTSSFFPLTVRGTTGVTVVVFLLFFLSLFLFSDEIQNQMTVHCFIHNSVRGKTSHEYTSTADLKLILSLLCLCMLFSTHLSAKLAAARIHSMLTGSGREREFG